MKGSPSEPTEALEEPAALPSPSLAPPETDERKKPEQELKP